MGHEMEPGSQADNKGILVSTTPYDSSRVLTIAHNTGRIDYRSHVMVVRFLFAAGVTNIPFTAKACSPPSWVQVLRSRLGFQFCLQWGRPRLGKLSAYLCSLWSLPKPHTLYPQTLQSRSRQRSARKIITKEACRSSMGSLRIAGNYSGLLLRNLIYVTIFGKAY